MEYLNDSSDLLNHVHFKNLVKDRVLFEICSDIIITTTIMITKCKRYFVSSSTSTKDSVSSPDGFFT